MANRKFTDLPKIKWMTYEEFSFENSEKLTTKQFSFSLKICKKIYSNFFDTARIPEFLFTTFEGLGVLA
jgi:hypothetical protein